MSDLLHDVLTDTILLTRVVVVTNDGAYNNSAMMRFLTGKVANHLTICERTDMY
ncbi:hypothetical protein RI367_006638, partial [Sorochytrium milnesiophthora]